MDKDNIRNEEDRDLTREHEGHPVATGVGAIGGGAAGAAIGTAVGGPIGTVVGAVIGAVAGGAGGYAVGEAIDPAAEDAYWQENHYKQPFAKSGSFDEYHAGYRTGYQGYDKYAAENRSFDEAEPDLQREYSAAETDVPWDKARDASRAAWNRVERGDAVRIPISEEQVKVGKREVEHGAATIRKEVRTERVNTPVDLKREELVIERTDAGGDVPQDAFREGELRVPLKKEEPVVQKEAKVVGAVTVGKRQESERKDISDTVRKEEVKVDQPDDRR
ncbi:MAG: hypothetical protein DLM52_08345 [Chthoniobacterales bacterium]|nr:MAG: hypothetical protein DLM52_08345 [Chthoniobacterales bacterium]